LGLAWVKEFVFCSKVYKIRGKSNFYYKLQESGNFRKQLKLSNFKPLALFFTDLLILLWKQLILSRQEQAIFIDGGVISNHMKNCWRIQKSTENARFKRKNYLAKFIDKTKRTFSKRVAQCLVNLCSHGYHKPQKLSSKTNKTSFENK